MEANENSGERKIKRFKVRERERGGSGTSSFFPRSPAARRTDPLTEGLEQAKYCDVVWYNSGLSNCETLERLQRRAGRVNGTFK